MWIVPNNHPLRQYLSAQAFVASKEELAELPDLGKSLSWRGSLLSIGIWSQKWKKVYWLPRLFGRTLKPSSTGLATFRESLTSYLQDIHANRSLMLAIEKAQKTKGTSTPISNEQLTLFAHDSYSLKTCEDTLLSDSEKSSARWKAWVTECSGEYSARRKRAQRIREKEFLSSASWKTPIANQQGTTNEGYTQKLHQQVQNWSTPNTNRSTQASEGYGENLIQQVNWPHRIHSTMERATSIKRATKRMFRRTSSKQSIGQLPRRKMQTVQDCMVAGGWIYKLIFKSGERQRREITKMEQPNL